MFTGIITDIGRIKRVEPRADARVTIETAYDTASIALGSSIALFGRVPDARRSRPGLVFDGRVRRNPCAHRSPACGPKAARFNLERALRVGDELGGHIVTGHVDGVGHVRAIERQGRLGPNDDRSSGGSRELYRRERLDRGRWGVAYRQHPSLIRRCAWS